MEFWRAKPCQHPPHYLRGNRVDRPRRGPRLIHFPLSDGLRGRVQYPPKLRLRQAQRMPSLLKFLRGHFAASNVILLFGALRIM